MNKEADLFLRLYVSIARVSGHIWWPVKDTGVKNKSDDFFIVYTSRLIFYAWD